MNWQIRFTYISLFIVGIILLIIGTSYVVNASSTSSLIVSLLVIAIGILDIIAAYFILRLKTFGRKLGLIVSYLGVLPGQSFILGSPFVFLLFSDKLRESFPLVSIVVPIAFFILVFLFNIIILLKKENKELFTR